MNELENTTLINKIEELLEQASEKVSRSVNNTLLVTYMEICRLIVEDINCHDTITNYETKSLRFFQKN